MAVEDEYRKHAERCLLVAARATKPADRAFWLLLAEALQMLVQDIEAKPPEEREGTETQLAPS
jgi:hypothetical protein